MDLSLLFERQSRLLGETELARLRSARVLVVGLGGLGSPAATELAAMGVGLLGLVDHDRVELSNLPRQLLHRPSDVGRPKVESAAETLLGRQPWTEIETHSLRVTSENAPALVARYDVVVDGSDNFATRYALSDACVRLGKPLVFAALGAWEGQLAVFDSTRGPCYRCLFPTPGGAGSCAELGVVAAVPGVLGALQALETVKWILDREPLIGRLLAIDFATLRFRTFQIEKNPECPCRKGGVFFREPFVTPEELAGMVGRCVILDIRSSEDRDAGHIPTSRSVSLSQLDDLTLRDDDVVIYCQGSRRAAYACDRILPRAPRARFLVGGFTEWKANGFEISN